jgi:NADH dehydrogenase FAD-containing subunit
MRRVSKDYYQVLIAGGGTAGITVAAQLRRKLRPYDVAIIEPSTKHYYQPLWTLVGAGVFPKQLSERSESAFIPQGADWIQDAVAEFRPEENCVITREGRPQETFPVDQSKERLSMYLFKAYALPRLDWDGMLRGRV